MCINSCFGQEPDTGVYCLKCKQVMWGKQLPDVTKCTSVIKIKRGKAHTCGNKDRNQFINISRHEYKKLQ